MSEEYESVIISDAKCSISLHTPINVRHNSYDQVIDIKAGAFEGTFRDNCYAPSLDHFTRQLRLLNQTLHGTVTLGQYDALELTFSGDGRGHILVQVKIEEFTLLLKYTINLDQTQLLQIIRGFERISGSL